MRIRYPISVICRAFSISLLFISTTFAIYYQIPFFARPTALGEAMVSISGDASSIFYNPAGMSSKTISFSLSEWFLDTRAVSCAGGYKYKEYFNLGAGVSYFSYGPMDYIDEQGNITGKFSAYLTQARIGLSKQYKLFSFGVATKLLNERIETITKTKFCTDVGVLVNAKLFNTGVGIQNFAVCEQTLVNWGISFRPIKELLVASDINFEEKTKVKIGIEYYYQPLFLRMGFANSRTSLGLGYIRNNLILDYAVSSHNTLGLTHQFSLTIR
ncbi:MAG: hypothetical protein N2201_05130 [candidate division WOR-3 bacterium]|nr:hypothetical protein [candidate division WOR-3 bacterium]